MSFDYSNPEKSLQDLSKNEDARREEQREKNRIPDKYNLDSRVIDVTRGEVQSGKNKGTDKWMLEVKLQDPGKAWHKSARTLHFPEENGWCMMRFWEILKAWGIQPSVLKGEKDPIMKLMSIIESAIEDGAKIPLRTEHKPDPRDRSKTQVNFMERAEDIEAVWDVDPNPVNEPDSQEVEEEETPEAEPEVEEVTEVVSKPKPRKANPYASKSV